jgi:hypothetical protein
MARVALEDIPKSHKFVGTQCEVSTPCHLPTNAPATLRNAYGTVTRYEEGLFFLRGSDIGWMDARQLPSPGLTAEVLEVFGDKDGNVWHV